MVTNQYKATNHYKTTNNYTVYSFSLLFYFIVAYMLIDSGSGKGRSPSVLTRVILYWMVFGIFIGLFELVLFFKHRYIASLPSINSGKPNFWYRTIPLHSILESKFWSKGWREYGDFCDSRYTTPMNIVHYIEIIHALTAFIYIFILYYFFRYHTLHTSFIGKLMVSIASIHLLFTFIYFITFYLHLTKNPIKQGMKFWSYLLLNVLWILMPLLVLVKGILILRDKKNK